MLLLLLRLPLLIRIFLCLLFLVDLVLQTSLFVVKKFIDVEEGNVAELTRYGFRFFYVMSLQVRLQSARPHKRVAAHIANVRSLVSVLPFVVSQMALRRE